jgi:hypothetical protein
MAARIAMIAITTNSSMRVKPVFRKGSHLVAATERARTRLAARVGPVTGLGIEHKAPGALLSPEPVPRQDDRRGDSAR